MEQLNSVTDDVEPLSHVIDLQSVMRRPPVRNAEEDALKKCPADRRFFQVPRSSPIMVTPFDIVVAIIPARYASAAS
jgi:hypothetical protein